MNGHIKEFVFLAIDTVPYLNGSKFPSLLVVPSGNIQTNSLLFIFFIPFNVLSLFLFFLSTLITPAFINRYFIIGLNISFFAKKLMCFVVLEIIRSGSNTLLWFPASIAPFFGIFSFPTTFTL